MSPDLDGYRAPKKALTLQDPQFGTIHFYCAKHKEFKMNAYVCQTKRTYCSPTYLVHKLARRAEMRPIVPSRENRDREHQC